MTGAYVLLAVLLACTAFGVWRARTDGVMRQKAPQATIEGPPADDRAPVVDQLAADALTPDMIGAPLGDRATLLQFSSTFCQPCRATSAVLQRVTHTLDDVTHVEVDVADKLDLARQLRVMRTPTTVVLDAEGREVARAGGVPTMRAVEDVVSQLRN